MTLKKLKRKLEKHRKSKFMKRKVYKMEHMCKMLN